MFPIGDDNSQRRTVPVVTWALVAINVIVFLLELAGGEGFILQWSFNPARFIQDPIGNMVTLLTSMFMHAGWLHLAGNMLYLLIFGDNVEDLFGHFKFLIFYLLCGFVAMTAQFVAAPFVNLPNLGASGAIAGVLGAYLVLFPQRRVRVLLSFFVVRMPAVIVIGAWIVIQVISGFGTLHSLGGAAGGVAYMAHIGGFLAGLVLSFFFRRRRQALTPPGYSL